MANYGKPGSELQEGGMIFLCPCPFLYPTPAFAGASLAQPPLTKGRKRKARGRPSVVLLQSPGLLRFEDRQFDGYRFGSFQGSAFEEHVTFTLFLYAKASGARLKRHRVGGYLQPQMATVPGCLFGG